MGQYEEAEERRLTVARLSRLETENAALRESLRWAMQELIDEMATITY